MTLASPNDEDDEMEDGDEGNSGDVISRAKGTLINIYALGVLGWLTLYV